MKCFSQQKTIQETGKGWEKSQTTEQRGPNNYVVEAFKHEGFPRLVKLRINMEREPSKGNFINEGGAHTNS